MPFLTNLEGTTEDKECKFIRSARGAFKVLQEGLAATAAGDNGAFNIWKDDNGKYRCESQRFCQIQDSQIFNRLKDIEPWMKVWLKKIL